VTGTALPSATTRLVALLGDPVAHSRSPHFQNAAFRAAGVDGVYLALRCRADEVPGLVRGIVRAGGAGNVTVPHKERVATLLDLPTELVRRTGACNTFWWAPGGGIAGDNTDVEGVAASVERLLGALPPGPVLLLGAGGAARAALVALLDGGAERVVVVNRTRERAVRMAQEAADPRVSVESAVPDGLSFGLAVNATSVGLHPGTRLPMDPEALGRCGALLDLVYASTPTPLLAEAHRLGIPALDGGEMLLRQGAAAFRRWWDQPPPVEVMREALQEAR